MEWQTCFKCTIIVCIGKNVRISSSAIENITNHDKKKGKMEQKKYRIQKIRLKENEQKNKNRIDKINLHYFSFFIFHFPFSCVRFSFLFRFFVAFHHSRGFLNAITPEFAARESKKEFLINIKTYFDSREKSNKATKQK